MVKKVEKGSKSVRIVISVLFAVAVILALTVFGWSLRAKNINDGRFMDEQDAVIRAEVQSAVSVLSVLNGKVEKGEMTVDDAKKLGSEIIREWGYGDEGKGYFWVDTTEGVNVVLYGKKDVEGKNRYNDSIKGVYYIQDIISMAQSGGGYTDYWYPQMNEEAPMRKRAYSMLFEPFGWVVGTGYYYDPDDMGYRKVVGADRDEHGCIGSAGYSWCEEKNKCLRIWEENCSVDE